MKLFLRISTLTFSFAFFTILLIGCAPINPPCDERTEKSVTYSNPGADNEWQTIADNTVAFYSVYKYDCKDNLLEMKQYMPGPDGKVETADDVLTDSEKNTYDSNGNMITTLITMIYSNVTSEMFGKFEYENGVKMRLKMSVDKGQDGKWNTADDVIAGVSKYYYDSNGNNIKCNIYYNAGPDGVWFTSDDVLGNEMISTFDARGNVMTSIMNGITPMPMSNAYTYKYDNNDFMIESIYYSNNTNGIWFDGDDVKFRSVSSGVDNNMQLLTTYDESDNITGKFAAIYQQANQINSDKVQKMISRISFFQL